MENTSPTPEQEQSLESAQPEGTVKASTEPAADNGAEPTPAPETPKTGKSFLGSLPSKVRESRYLYIGAFVFFVIIIAVVSFLTIKNGNDKSQDSSAATGLTADNLATLKGTTTLVGDPKQILDIQSNTVFEGQILVRGEVNAAGDLKVGKDLSVAGIANFAQLQTTGNLAVNGSQTLKGNLAVSGDGSFSRLSTNQLTTGALSLSGDLTVTKHILVSGSLPSVSGGAVGSGGTVSISGSDTAGTITINTGAGAGAGTLVTVTFASAFSRTPHVVVTPVGSAAGALNFYITRTATGFTIATTNAPAAGVSFSFDYIIFG